MSSSNGRRTQRTIISFAVCLIGVFCFFYILMGLFTHLQEAVGLGLSMIVSLGSLLNLYRPLRTIRHKRVA